MPQAGLLRLLKRREEHDMVLRRKKAGHGSKVKNQILAIFLFAAVVPTLLVGSVSIIQLRRQMQEHYEKQLAAEGLRANSVLSDITTTIYTSAEALITTRECMRLFGAKTPLAAADTEYSNFNTHISILKNNTAAISNISVYTNNPNIPSGSYIRYIPFFEDQPWFPILSDKGWNHWGCTSTGRQKQDYYELTLVRRIGTVTNRYAAYLVVQLDNNNIKNRMNQNSYKILSTVNNYPVFYANNADDLKTAFPFQEEYHQDFCSYSGPLRLADATALAHIVSFRPYGTRDMFYICVSAPDAYGSIRGMTRTFCLIIAISILVPAFIVLLFSSVFTGRIAVLKTAMHQASEGDYNIIDHLKGDDELSDVFTDLKRTVELIHKKDEEIYTAQLNEQMLANRQQQMEYKLLASQINPHFLYNTLETIRMQALSAGNRDVARSIKLLGKAMRYVLENSGTSFTTLARELSYIETYLEIQKLRFADRFTFEIVLDEGIHPEDYRILPLLLQPIVENAIVHGLDSVEEKGCARLHISADETLLRITVSDNGCGIDAETLARIRREIEHHDPQDSRSIGLYNTNQRIHLRYGDACGMHIESSEGSGTTVTLRLPAQNIRSCPETD